MKTNVVLQGDCLDVMREMEDNSVDLTLTDPPYDSTTHLKCATTSICGIAKKTGRFGDLNFDCMEDLHYISELLRITKRWIILFTSIEMCGKIQAAYPEEYIRSGIWDRISNTPQLSGDRPAQACEAIILLHNKGTKEWNGGGKAAIWRYMVERGHKQHPTQKPLKLIEHLILDFSYEGELIFDPFVGSGTTAEACIRTGRNYIGVERDPDYFRIATTRIEKVKQQMKLTPWF